MHILQKKSFTTSFRRRKTLKDFKRKYPIIFQKYRCFDVNGNNKTPRACKKTKADENEPSTSATGQTETKRGRSTSKSRTQNDENAAAPVEVKRTKGRKPETPLNAKDEVAPTAVKRTRKKTQVQSEAENVAVSTPVKRTRGGKPQTQSDVENEVVSTVAKRTKPRSQTSILEPPTNILTTIDGIEPKDLNTLRRSSRTRGEDPENVLELPPTTRKRTTTPKTTKGKSKKEILLENQEHLICEPGTESGIEYTDENQYNIKNIESTPEKPQRKTRKKSTQRSTKHKKEDDTYIETSEPATTEQYFPTGVECVEETLYGIENVNEPQYSIENVDENQQICPLRQDFSNQIEDDVQLGHLREDSDYQSELQEPPNEDDIGPSVFDKTMYLPENAHQEEEYIPDDRDWSAGLNPDFQIDETLQNQPVKSCLKRSAPKPQSHAIRSYKFFDENDELKVVIDGISHSTFIKRFIIYLRAIKGTFDMETIQLIIPGLNLEVRLLANLQMITEQFREELIPMLVYSLQKKDSNMYHRILLEQFRETLNYFLNLRITNGNFYEFNYRREIYHFTDDPMYDKELVNRLPRTSSSIFSESFYSFCALLLYGVFIRRVHYTVVQQMFRSFSRVFQKAATKIMETK